MFCVTKHQFHIFKGNKDKIISFALESCSTHCYNDKTEEKMEKIENTIEINKNENNNENNLTNKNLDTNLNSKKSNINQNEEKAKSSQNSQVVQNQKIKEKRKGKLKDNNIFRYSIIAFSILVMTFFRFIPTNGSLSQSGMAVIGVFLGTLLLWLTISIDWPSILCILFLGTIDGLTFKSLFMSSFGSDTFVFLLCTFICTYALSTTSIIKKISVWFITNKLSRKGAWWFVVMYTFSIILLGMFISPSVLFVVLLPILNEIYNKCNIEKGSKLGAMLMIILAFSVSISSGMTPIAHVFPIISLGIYENLTGLTISYAKYILLAIPVGLISSILMLVIFRFVLRPDMSKLKSENLSEIENTEKLNKRDIAILIVFVCMVLLWIVPSLLQNILPGVYKTINGFGTAFPALIGVVIMSILKIEDKPLVSIGEACKKGVPFSSLIMCAGTLALSSAITNDTIGIKLLLVNNMSSLLSGFSPILLLIIFALWAMIQTNVSSNMVTATLVTTIAVPILQSINAGFIFPATVVVIGMLSAFAFATPPSMPHIAIAASSEYANTKSVFVYGIILALVSVIVSVCVCYGLGILIF